MKYKNAVTAVFLAAWILLLAVLMIRLPVADLLDGLSVLPVDLILSVAFILIGAAGAVLGYIFRAKVLLLLSAIQGLFLLIFSLFIALYLITFNGDMIAYGLYFINPFTAILTYHFVFFLILAPLLILLPVIFMILYGIRRRKEKKNVSETNLSPK